MTLSSSMAMYSVMRDIHDARMVPLERSWVALHLKIYTATHLKELGKKFPTFNQHWVTYCPHNYWLKSAQLMLGNQFAIWFGKLNCPSVGDTSDLTQLYPELPNSWLYFQLGNYLLKLMGKIWLNKVTSKIDQNGKNINCSMVNQWFDRISMLMVEPYPTPKPNPTAKSNPISCPKPDYVDKL